MGTVLVILCVLLILFLISFIKEFSSNYSENRQNIYSSSQPQNTSSTTSLVDSASSVEITSSQEVSSQEVSSTPPPPPKVDKGLVPESEKVLSGYFKDAVFVGDSVTEGIKLYGIMSDATVFSYTGLGLDNIYTKDVIKQPDGTSIPVMDAVRLCNANKFYVLIGVNSIAYSKDSFIQKYAAIVQSIKEFHPNAIIYVQSITPVAVKKAIEHGYNLNNETINEYNEALLEMAIEKGVYYLDIHSALADETGALPDNATTDGLHFGPTYYQKWFDYLKTHTVS
jgi:hypothetical protein